MKVFVSVLCGVVLLLSWTCGAFPLDPLDQAQLFLEAGNVDQAIALLEPLVEQDADPEYLGDVVELLDSLFMEKGEVEKALAVLQKYVARFPHASRSYLFRYWMAKHEEELGRDDRALALLEELMRLLPPEDPFALRVQVAADLAYLFRYKKKDPQKALAMYKEVMELSDNPEEKLQAKMSSGLCYEDLGEVEQALALYREMVQEAPGSFFERFARLRIVYLTNPPERRFASQEELVRELREALQAKDLNRLKRLAKKGDFWSGVNFSEFDVDDASAVLEYFARYLPQASHLVIAEKPKEHDDSWVLRVEGWSDPEYNILYLVLAEGRYGWEWKGVILSSTTLEACQESSEVPHGY
ncbi:MAG: tetratricopeptide repeat protein [Candidatus Caldatribacterium sp.]|uniref:tetratricopeptide repeat protein n=1 Tax=Candidatus Caldatribacterium sp. TaxID=2282143 RepID=UPI0029967D10|nr:tetratricopeptide repeat protein [Candidatus Caldatribacterium sp.]MCX7731030.1 tetratricopeptide repeat protein [Candidatus Caldatribacterium sp.]MDW8081651.1 tetratricopeptide repeat protein [Candidatus Calescibacterium sp.]